MRQNLNDLTSALIARNPAITALSDEGKSAAFQAARHAVGELLGVSHPDGFPHVDLTWEQIDRIFLED